MGEDELIDIGNPEDDGAFDGAYDGAFDTEPIGGEKIA